MSTESRVERAANLFDVRRIIGGVFVVWGLLLTILGLTESDREIDKAAGININLYAGLGMLVVGIIFLLWAFTRPLGRELAEAEAGAPAGSAANWPRRRPASPPARRSADRVLAPQRSRAGAPGATARAPAGRAIPGGSRARTDPPKPPPTIRVPAAPAAFRRSTVASTSGTDAS